MTRQTGEPMPTDWPVQWHEVIDSTNEEARRVIAAGRASPGWIAAREQTAGRGRLSRTWISTPGNLFASALFPLARGVAEAAELPFVAALAVAEAAERLVPGLQARLKWPNDVRVNQAKLSGILIESVTQSAQVWAIVGIGINVRHAPDSLGQQVTSLASQGAAPGVNAETALEALREAFTAARILHSQGFDLILNHWLARAEALGERIVVGLPAGPVEGIFDGLEPDGALRLLRDDGQLSRVSAGDVRLVREG